LAAGTSGQPTAAAAEEHSTAPARQGLVLAYGSGAIAVVVGAIVVGAFFPDVTGEKELLASYQRADTARVGLSPPAEPAAPVA
jgi:hypothetical protein